MNNKQIDISSILKKAEGYARDALKWANGRHYDTAYKRHVTSMALIELVEVSLTGSSGASYLGLMSKGHVNSNGVANDLLARIKIIRNFIK